MNSIKTENNRDIIGFENKFQTREEHGDAKQRSSFGAIFHNVKVINELKHYINTKGSSALKHCMSELIPNVRSTLTNSTDVVGTFKWFDSGVFIKLPTEIEITNTLEEDVLKFVDETQMNNPLMYVGNTCLEGFIELRVKIFFGEDSENTTETTKIMIDQVQRAIQNFNCSVEKLKDELRNKFSTEDIVLKPSTWTESMDGTKTQLSQIRGSSEKTVSPEGRVKHKKLSTTDKDPRRYQYAKNLSTELISIREQFGQNGSIYKSFMKQASINFSDNVKMMEKGKNEAVNLLNSIMSPSLLVEFQKKDYENHEVLWSELILHISNLTMKEPNVVANAINEKVLTLIKDMRNQQDKYTNLKSINMLVKELDDLIELYELQKVNEVNKIQLGLNYDKLILQFDEMSVAALNSLNKNTCELTRECTQIGKVGWNQRKDQLRNFLIDQPVHSGNKRGFNDMINAVDTSKQEIIKQDINDGANNIEGWQWTLFYKAHDNVLKRWKEKHIRVKQFCDEVYAELNTKIPNCKKLWPYFCVFCGRVGVTKNCRHGPSGSAFGGRTTYAPISLPQGSVSTNIVSTLGGGELPAINFIGRVITKYPPKPKPWEDYMLLDSGANALMIVRSEEGLNNVTECNLTVESFTGDSINIYRCGEFLNCKAYVSKNSKQIFGLNTWVTTMRDNYNLTASYSSGGDSTATCKLMIGDKVIINAPVCDDQLSWYPRQKLIDILTNIIKEKIL